MSEVSDYWKPELEKARAFGSDQSMYAAEAREECERVREALRELLKEVAADVCPSETVVAKAWAALVPVEWVWMINRDGSGHASRVKASDIPAMEKLGYTRIEA